MVAAWEALGAEILKNPDAFIDERDRRRLAAFTRRLYPSYQTAAHITRLCAALEVAVATPGARLIVTLPPRHSKSLHVSEHLPAWYLGNHPDKRVIAAANTAELAHTFSRRVRNKLVDPHWPFPHVALSPDLGNVRMWDLDGHLGGYVAVGVGGTPTGHGADLLIIDDPIRSAADADSEVVRAALWEWYTGTIRTRLEPDAAIILTATRWHEDDLTGRLLAAAETGGERWDHLHLPAIDDDGAALWPERWPVSALERTRAAIGARAFDAQFQGQPSPAEGGTFKRHWWRYWTPATLPPIDSMTKVVQSWDMTFRETKAGSYVVGQVWGKHGANCYLLDQYRERVDFPGAIAAVRALTARWPAAHEKIVEDKANGPAVVATLKGEISGLIEVSPQGGKEARANAISYLVEAGNVYLPDPTVMPWIDDFREEAAAFPNGKNDDQVDAMSQALVRLADDGERFYPTDGGTVADFLMGR